MTELELAAGSTPWSRPQRCPAGFEPSIVYSGPDPMGAPLEIAIAGWTGTGSPTRDAMNRLHALRLAGRVSPVIIVANSSNGRTWLFGPNVQAQVVGPLEVEQATRFLQAGLDQPNGIAARQRVAALYDALGAGGMPGVANAGLFANNELTAGTRTRPDWSDAVERSTLLLPLRRQQLVGELGYATSNTGASALLLHAAGAEPRAVAVMLDESEAFDAESARFAVSPIAYGLSYAARHNVDWLIATRGSQIRLYPARQGVGVGRKGQTETYFELDLALLDHETAGFLTLVFSADALASGGSTSELLSASAQYAVGLSERLRSKIYEQVVPDIAVAVAKQLPALGHALDRAGLDLAYQLTLRILFRLLFQAYAEDRKLLPYGENPRYDRNALNTITADLVVNPDQAFDIDSESLWDDLTQVWRVIDKGDRAWGVPAYNGGLFSTDADLHPEGALLDRIVVTNDILGPALRSLLIDVDDSGTIGPIDFRALSVREFGTIYEGLLESNLALADVDLTLDSNDTWVPAGPDDRIEAAAGDAYFHNISGQRKGTGSYFTPDFVVEHLLERSLDPACDAHLARIGALLEKGDTAGAGRDFFDFRVADLAMGSAHFLTAAIDHIEAKFAAFLAEHPVPGVAQELHLLEQAAVEAAGPDTTPPDPSSLLRRQIARRCIYGLDLNPVSVELARVAIWIHTFVRGLPMSSLDHNLVRANSLTGIGTIDEALDALVPNRSGQTTIFDEPIETALAKAAEILVDLSNAAEASKADAVAAARGYRAALTSAKAARDLFDGAVLRRMGVADAVSAVGVEQVSSIAATDAAKEVVAAIAPAHFPALFPEVFLRDDAGFDVVVGNPPWEKLKVEEQQFWTLRFPGLRSLQMTERSGRISELEAAHPDLVVELDSQVAAGRAMRDTLSSGPYPGIGTGHVDLYKAFAWRNWQLTRSSGRCGVVLPRAALTGPGMKLFREDLLTTGEVVDVCVVTNTRQWVFAAVHPQYAIALLVAGRAKGKTVKLCGPFHSRAEFDQGRTNLGVVAAEEFAGWSNDYAFPLLHDSGEATIFRAMRKHPEFRTGRFRPVIELRPVEDRDRIDTNLAEPGGPIPIYTGGTINIWNPDHGSPYGYGKSDLLNHLLEKTNRSASLARSPFHGMTFDSIDAIPAARPRIAFRDIARNTDTRTVIAALIPPSTAVMHSCPYLLRRDATEHDEAFLLGVMCSIPFDWYARRVVELHLTFELLGSFPVPSPAEDDPRRRRVIEISGALAAVDDRYAGWAASVGAKVGSVTSQDVHEELEYELDALVAHLYDLDRTLLISVFETFHRGWNYTPRLEKVLSYFDAIEGP